MARPPKIYFIAKKAKNWKEVTFYLEQVIFPVASPKKQLESYLSMREYALKVYYQFHPPLSD